jgi:hypothetical protein
MVKNYSKNYSKKYSKKYNTKKRKAKKTIRKKSIKKMKGGNIITQFSKDGELYNISLYNVLPENIQTAMTKVCTPTYSEQDFEDMDLTDTSNDYYILSKVSNSEIIGFVMIKNNYCSDSCFNCEKKCSYILLLCIKQEYRGRNGIFGIFFTNLEQFLKNHKNVQCIRLTSVNSKTTTAYNRIGFQSEHILDPFCEAKMIKEL